MSTRETDHMPKRNGDHLKIEDYIDAVETMAKTKSQIPFINSNPEHANIVLSTIIRYSTDQVRIYDNCIKGDIADRHPSFLNSLEKFLHKAKNVKIALQSDHENSSDAYNQISYLSNKYPDELNVRLINENFRRNIQDTISKFIIQSLHT